MVSSIHTNTPEYARITTARLLESALGRGMAYRVANDRLALPDMVSSLLERRLIRHLESVTFAMGSYGGDADTRYAVRHSGVSLRRGLDRELFSPARRDRAWLEARFAIPSDQLIVMYAGKLNAGKNVPLLVPILQQLRQMGVAAHLLCAGAGSEQEVLEAALGPAVICPGPLAQEELARAYASADLFLFPSMIDESGNAAVEALASGLPTLLAAGNGVASRMADCAGLRVLPGDRPDAWAEAIAELAAAPERRAAMGRAARLYVEACVPSWGDVLIEDLVPVWQRAVARAAA
jgi:glycosyltransferase involved in cell wall biosynthesis